ncbi:MAG: HEAT repeat domain-containing protein, partial [Nitrospirae bacterium]|nr:HEAT repeat domain-containing protein [Nitrospirota bacterium]
LPRPRIAAARSLGQIGGKELVPMLKNALKDQDDAVRATVGGALGRVLYGHK